MTKSQLISQLQSGMPKLTKKDVGALLDHLAQLLMSDLSAHGTTVLPWVGSFKIVQRKARVGRNPRTGASMNIPAKKAIKYVPGKWAKAAAHMAK